jgi:hypothetical protein
MPLHALRKTECGFAGSTMMEKTSESSITPCLMFSSSCRRLRLPGQMPCAGVDDIRDSWGPRQATQLVNLLAVRRADQRPGRTRIVGAEDSLETSRKKHPWIRRRLRKGANRLSAQAFDILPVLAAVAAYPQSSAGLVQLPCGNINVAGFASSTTMLSSTRSSLRSSFASRRQEAPRSTIRRSNCRGFRDTR